MATNGRLSPGRCKLIQILPYHTALLAPTDHCGNHCRTAGVSKPTQDFWDHARQRWQKARQTRQRYQASGWKRSDEALSAHVAGISLGERGAQAACGPARPPGRGRGGQGERPAASLDAIPGKIVFFRPELRQNKDRAVCRLRETVNRSSRMPPLVKFHGARRKTPKSYAALRSSRISASPWLISVPST